MELFKNSNISSKSKQNSKILQPVYQGPRWVRLMKKTGGRKSRDTLPLRWGWDPEGHTRRINTEEKANVVAAV